MCVVSMVGDHFSDKFKPIQPAFNYVQGISQAEFDQLKKEVLEMKELLKKAIKYDKDNNEPDCQKEDKIKLLKEIAKAVGVDLEDIFKDTK